MKNKLTVMVALAAVLLVLSFWLTWGLHISGSVALMLQGCAVALVIWAFLARYGRPVGLLELAGKGFAVSFVLTIVLWFVSALAGGSWVYFSSVLWVFSIAFGFRILPYSLLPVAICVTAYGVSRKPLPAWMILLSSWYVSIYGVFAAYDVWWLVFIFPYLTGTPYFGGGGLIALDMLLVFLAFIAACVFTAIYAVLRRPKRSPPP
jgi:hypothetical protein